MARLELPDGSSIAVVDGLTIGRVAACGLVLDDDKVSRQHARIVVEGGVAEVEDLGSRNGVYLNGHRVQRRVLRDGDLLRIGRTDLRFVAAAAAAAPPSGPGPGEDLLGGEPEPAGAAAARAPARAPSPPPPEVEVLEFVDEVVEVRRPAAPAAAPGSAAVRRTAPAREGGVLQFSKRAGAGALGEDLAQLGGPRRLLLVAVGLAVAAAAAFVAMRIAG